MVRIPKNVLKFNSLKYKKIVWDVQYGHPTVIMLFIDIYIYFYESKKF